MMTLMYHHILSRKKKWVLLISLGVIALYMMLFVDFNVSHTERLYDLDHYVITYRALIDQSLYMLGPLMTLLMMHDQDMRMYHHLYAYFGRFIISIHHLWMMLWVLMVMLVSIGLIYTNIITYFFHQPYDVLMSYFIHFSIDHIMLMMMLLLTIHQRHHIYAYLIIMLMIVLSISQLQERYLFIYYLLPIGQYQSVMTTYGIYYKMSYIVMLFWFYIWLNQTKDFRLNA